MPRECPTVFRSAPAAAGIDSAKRKSVRLPIAIAPIRRRDFFVALKTIYCAPATAALPADMAAFASLIPDWMSCSQSRCGTGDFAAA